LFATHAGTFLAQKLAVPVKSEVNGSIARKKRARNKAWTEILLKNPFKFFVCSVKSTLTSDDIGFIVFS
jgi:hypothetical protein